MPDIRAANLNLFLVFDALLATHSVTRAAERVGLTQSGASNALAQLRQLFDDPLFERHGHAMRPTPRAIEVGGDIRAGIEALGRALAAREFDAPSLRRTFQLAMPDAVQLVVLPTALARIRREAPGVRVRVQTWPDQRVPAGLAAREIDLFAGYVDAIPEEHEVATLYDDSYVLMLRAGHPALVGDAADLERWLASGHVIVTREQTGATGVDRALADLGLERSVVLLVDNALLLPPILAATDLVAAVGRRWAERWQVPGLRVVAPPVELPRGRVRAVWHRRDGRDPAFRWFRDIVMSAAAS